MKMTSKQQTIVAIFALIALVAITAIIALAATTQGPPLCALGHEVVKTDETLDGFSTTERYCDGK